jgi:nitrate reductase assembly molybdenum cofactor insertion protein NarJ
MKPSHYHVIADLFDYPTEGYQERVQNVLELLKTTYPDAAKPVEVFLSMLPSDLHDLQELFTRTFDVQAITTLDTGYVLFGDDYKRGELLSHLNREHNAAKNNCGIELADHLPNLLRLISLMEDQELAKELVQEIVYPAVVKMMREFDPDRVETRKASYKKHYKTLIEVQKNRELIYLLCLEALDCIFAKDYILSDTLSKKPSGDFLRSVVQEIEIEAQADSTS